jgi:hypothetical protein
MPWINNVTRSVFADDDAVVGTDGTMYSGTWEKSTIPDLVHVIRPPEPAGVAVIGWKIGDDNVWVWITRDFTALEQIGIIEQRITPRRIREATLGTDNGWLSAREAEIAALREGLRYR